MINKIEIQNFKSILSDKVETGSLNLFTGVNGSGKSTFLQSLLLIRQSFLGGNFFRKPVSLKLSGGDSLVNVGTYKDILCQLALKNNERISINVHFDKNTLNFISTNYNSENRDSNFLNGEINGDILLYEKEKIFTDRFQYLGAERIEPNEDYPRFKSDELLGKKGEYTAHFIEKYGTQDIPIKKLSLKARPNSHTLINQVNDWMSEISDSIEVVTNENLSTNKIELSYRYKLADGTPTQNQKPQNVGFGITHTLPIIVAILSAKPNDILIIENPETHLHPRGQSRLSILFALAAENGIQLFIETHSDHIVNGLRVAVKKKLIDKEKVYLNYFSKTPQKLSSIKRIHIQSEGGLDEWPDGFFDEWDNLLNDLL